MVCCREDIEKKIRECWGDGVEMLNKMVRNDLPGNVLCSPEVIRGESLLGRGTWAKLLAEAQNSFDAPTLELKLCFSKGPVLKMLVRHS